MDYRKLFRDEDVIISASQVMKKKRKATVIEIRDKLREKNFWATKKIVEEVMETLSTEGFYRHDFKSPRHYFLPKTKMELLIEKIKSLIPFR